MTSIVMVLCWIGVFQSFLLSAYFISAGRKSVNQVFLGLTIALVAIRAAKSTLFLFHTSVPLWILNVGFAAHAAIGPMLFLYTMSLNASFIPRLVHGVHFIPAMVILLFSQKLSLNSFWYKGGYSTLLIYTLAYTILYVWRFTKAINTNDVFVKAVVRWISILLATFTLFQFSYFSNYILRLTDYSSGPVLYSVLIYFITFIVIKNNQVFQAERRKKYQNINLSDAEMESHFQVISNIMEHQKPYLDVAFSVQKLSDLTSMPGYLISSVLSDKAKLNFNQYINGFRIEDAKIMLSNPKFDYLTIAAIAYECGFNSLSSFNTAFKKQVGVTPSAFKAGRSTVAKRE